MHYFSPPVIVGQKIQGKKEVYPQFAAQEKEKKKIHTYIFLAVVIATACAPSIWQKKGLIKESLTACH